MNDDDDGEQNKTKQNKATDRYRNRCVYKTWIDYVKNIKPSLESAFFSNN